MTGASDSQLMRRLPHRRHSDQPHLPDTGDAPPSRSSHDPSSPSLHLTLQDKTAESTGQCRGGVSATWAPLKQAMGTAGIVTRMGVEMDEGEVCLLCCKDIAVEFC
eukprot:CAMPEP_0169459374 /NCGR_PEP_ID=MMETSP1042-20121227/17922_1 /TAXON_ID=464988 /ORGANISM="Hemiselmis andersenii, Strain CCMP1180" /LENGTH=105 /DNA_ID=CAMNT_0009571799 /DNA_START=19 /DNA_END=333 /DNA_ORIENTATION=+